MYYTLTTNLRKQDVKKAVIILSREAELQGNLYYIHNELIKQLKGVRIHFVYTENKMNLKLFIDAIHISNAKYLLLDDYYLPVYLIKPHKKLKIIQLWHAAGAFKKFGYSTIGTKFGPSENYLKVVPVHSNYTHVYVSSSNVVPYYAEAFNMDDSNIYPCGIPRVDMFNDHHEKNVVVNKILTNYPMLKDQSYVRILIAPTYRAEGMHQESDISIVDEWLDIIAHARKDIYFIFKAHPYMSLDMLESLRAHPNVIVTNEYFINEWMLISDAFITDYSSSVFDYSILNRPLAHYVPDLYEYRKNRGFYEDILVISDGDVIEDKESLFEWINKREKHEQFDTSRMIEYNFDNIKGVSEKIVSHFIHS